MEETLPFLLGQPGNAMLNEFEVEDIFKIDFVSAQLPDSDVSP
jgi:hypothetical protein